MNKPSISHKIEFNNPTYYYYFTNSCYVLCSAGKRFGEVSICLHYALNNNRGRFLQEARRVFCDIYNGAECRKQAIKFFEEMNEKYNLGIESKGILFEGIKFCWFYTNYIYDSKGMRSHVDELAYLFSVICHADGTAVMSTAPFVVDNLDMFLEDSEILCSSKYFKTSIPFIETRQIENYAKSFILNKDSPYNDYCIIMNGNLDFLKNFSSPLDNYTQVYFEDCFWKK